jgi:hypothetical protein
MSEDTRAGSITTSPIPALRVLDVQGTTSEKVLLRVLSSDNAKYAALSHVRDMDHSSIVVGARRGLEEGSVTLQSLPQVYQDAIRMTRQLGLRYLWIAALW